MSQKHCNLTRDREETLIAYLYDDIDPAGRAAFEEHLRACDACLAELGALGDVRARLARWSPPEPNFVRAGAAGSTSPADSRRRRSRWARLTAWTAGREIPAWAQVAAASLFLGVAAGLANLDVRYDRNGLSIRTGWSRSANPAAAVDGGASRLGPYAYGPGPAGVRDPAAAPWRADLTALERQLRSEMRSVQLAAVPSRPAPSEAEIARRIRTMLDESERRQRNELALGLAEMSKELYARTQQMNQIGRRVKDTEDRLGDVGMEMLRTRSSLNYIMKVNQRH